MTRFNLLILIFSLLAVSCTTRDPKIDTKKLIPEEEFISVITDVYIADGLLTLPKYHSMYASLDSMTAYYPVIERHGFTKEAMDNTVKYYFIKNPKKLISIYDKVLGILTEMESRAEKEGILQEERINNLWRGKEHFFYPSSSVSDSAFFDIVLNKPGTYSLSYSAILYPDDQSVNPSPTVYTCNSVDPAVSKRHYIKTLKYLKDGQDHNYTLTFYLPDSIPVHFGGLLYDFENLPDKRDKHVAFEKFYLRYVPGPAI